MSAAALIELQQVGLRYQNQGSFAKGGAYWALSDVSFTLHAGETLGIIGRNGAGKSTLLQVLAGILAPDRGRVLRQPCRICLLSLQVGFNPHLTGVENVYLSGMFLGMSRSRIRQRLPEILAFAELEDFATLPIRTYSTGMKARLGFAIAVHGEPDVLLLDEVMAVGDAGFREKSGKKMREIIQSNAAVVLVSHNAKTIAETCQTAVWIEKGRSISQGSSEEVLASYAASQAHPA